MINFNEPVFTEKGIEYIKEAIINNRRLNGDGPFTKKCTEWFEDNLHTKVLLTTSCTHALEMAAILSEIEPGDEVIMPAYTFVSTANAFVLRGAKLVFVDIRKDTLNIDEKLIEDAITDRTKAIVPVHYAGVGCEMDEIMDVAGRHKLVVVEDAAQGMMASYKGKTLGTIGDFGAYSFHETKNYTMGEGGLSLINNSSYMSRAEIIREKGTDRSRFFRGEVDKYSWVDLGSSYLPSEMNAAYLYAQLEEADKLLDKRLGVWKRYHEGFLSIEEKGYIERPFVPEYCNHNAHMYYIKTADINERQKLIEYLAEHGVGSVFHYVPLHTSSAGKRYGRFHGDDVYTTTESERLLRLPMHDGLSMDDVDKVIETVKEFFLKP